MDRNAPGDLEFGRELWVVWCPVGLAVGIGVYFSLMSEPPLWLGPVVMTGALVGWLASRRWPTPRLRRMTPALVVVITIGAGFTAAQVRTATLSNPVLSERIGPTTAVGRVERVEIFANGLRLRLSGVRLSGLGPQQTPDTVTVRLRGIQPVVEAGNWVKVRAVVSPPSPPVAPGAFDFQRNAFFKGIGGVGFGIGKLSLLSSREDADFESPRYAAARFRTALTQRIVDAVPRPVGGVAAALMTGERGAVPEASLTAMRDSGLAHLLAISGLHIGLVAGLLFAGLRMALALTPTLALRYPIKKWAAAAAILGAFAYAVIAGATVPTQRAFLMIGLALLAVMLDRRGLSMRSVAWAAAIILLFRPESLVGPSFQMSFAAVVALVATYEAYARHRARPSIEGGDGWVSKILRYLFGVALTSLVAGAATAPFAIYHFHRFADYGLAANLLAVPITALWVMPWAIGAFLAMPFGLEALPLTAMGWGIAAVLRVAETVASWPGAVTLVPATSVGGLIVVALGGLWLCLWRDRRRFIGIVAIAAGLSTVAMTNPPQILIEGNGKLQAILVDDGGLLVSDARPARFARKTWSRLAGTDQGVRRWPASGSSRDGHLTCDINGCLYRHNGQIVALTRGDGALSEDCWRADAVISMAPIRAKCPATVVIDRFDLWRKGAHALWLEGDLINVETVNGERGRRPWVIRPKAKPQKPTN